MKDTTMNTHNRKAGITAVLAATVICGNLACCVCGCGEADAVFERDRYLLLDSRIIESTQNARLTLGVVHKDPNNPLFKEDKPWEPYISNLYGKVIYDEQDRLYRCWYGLFIKSELESNTPRARRAWVKWKESRRAGGVCYATSKDGIHWEKPDLGIIEFDGSTRNNIVLRYQHGVGVLRDVHETDPRKRYKAILPSHRRMGTRVWFSPDGLHWKMHKLPRLDHGDTYNCVFRDPALGRYVLFTRHWGGRRLKNKRYGGLGYRQVSRSDSPDFLNWSKAKVVFEGPNTDLQIHDMIVFRHAGVYIGLVGLFDTIADRQYVQLAWSPDSFKWRWVCPDMKLIPNSRHIGDYDWGCIFATPPIFKKDEILIYYGASANRFFGWRDSFLALARLRPDGFAGYEQIAGGSNRTMTVTTRRVAVNAGSLRLSADVVSSGYVKVIALDEDRKELAESELIVKTATDAEVKWKGGFSLEELRGRHIRLRFKSRDATLYSFSFGD